MCRSRPRLAHCFGARCHPSSAMPRSSISSPGRCKWARCPTATFIDINMPLIYFIHTAVVALGGMSNMTWRACDLAAAAVMSGLILALLWPAGRAPAVHAVLIVLVTHLVLGPYSAGQAIT
jgi:hypothetical protein